jgi:hypothetical protein
VQSVDAAIDQFSEPTDGRQFAAAHAVVVALRDGDVEPDLVLEVLNELPDVGPT